MVNVVLLVGFLFLVTVSGQLLKDFRMHEYDLASLVDGLSSFSSKPAALILTATSQLSGPYDSLLVGRNVLVLSVGDTVKDTWPLDAQVFLLVLGSRDEADVNVERLMARVIWASYYELLVLVGDDGTRDSLVLALHRRQFPGVVLVTDGQDTVVYSPYQFKAASPAVEVVVKFSGFPQLREELANRPRVPFTMIMTTMLIIPMVYTRKLKIHGYDWMLLESAVRRLGATAHLVEPDDGFLLGARFPNGSFMGSVGDLAAGRSDIGANCRYVQPQWRDTIDYTYPQTQDDYCLVVPKADRLSPLLVVTLAFEWNIWVALALTLALSSVVWCSLGKQVSAQRAVLDVYRLVVTGSLGSKVFAIPKRCFVFTHVILSIVLTALYGGTLVSFYTSPAYLADINSLEMVDSVVSVIYSFGPLIDIITNVDESDVMNRLNRKFKPVLTSLDWSRVVSRIAAGDHEAVLMDHNFARFSARNPSLVGEDGRPLLHEVRECALSPAFLAFAMRRNSPLLAPLDTLLLRMVSAGLHVHYEASTDHDLSVAGLVSIPQHSRRADPLKLSHLAAPGLVLGLGLSLAGACFACELLKFRIRYHKRHQTH